MFPVDRPRGRRERRTVTALFVDLVDSTGLGERHDPETVETIVTRFYEVSKQLLESYGGTVQKYSGDAILAVFGVPRLHEDDALRAVFAATALQAALDQLNEELWPAWGVRLSHRVGVNTGAVVIRDPDRDDIATLGDPVNVAARLQQAAGEGDVLIGDATYQLIRDRVAVEPLPDQLVKGREQPVTAWRLRAIDRRQSPFHGSAAMVGRERDLKVLCSWYERMIAEARCHVATVRGDIGVGKTRLVAEFVARLGDGALVLQTRCPSYGDDMTYGPLAQLVRQAAGIRRDQPPDRQRMLLERVAAGDQRITARVAPLLGLAASVGEPEDAYRALGQVFESIAEHQPLVITVDDVELAEPSMVEFLRRATELLRNAAVLVICLVRSELFDHPDAWSWSGALRNGLALELLPLGQEETKQFVTVLLRGVEPPREVTELVLEATGGFPLFIEEHVKFLIDGGALRFDGGRWVATTDLAEIGVSQRTQTILAARLDRLTRTERIVIERAAILGREYQVADLVRLSPELSRETVERTLRVLVRKELLDLDPADPATLPAGGVFRFHHSHIRETAYQGIAKTARAELHARCAEQLERNPDGRVETLNRLAFHLFQVYTARRELGRDGPDLRRLASRAGERFAAAGHEYVRSNFPASGIPVLRKALELLPRGTPSALQAQLDLAQALRYQSLRQAMDQYQQAVKEADGVGDRRIREHARLGYLEVAWFHGHATSRADCYRQVEEAIRIFEEVHDDSGLGRAWRLRAYLESAIGAASESLESVERALELAQRTGDERLEASVRCLRDVVMHWGPVAIDEVVRASEEDVAWAQQVGSYSLEAGALGVLARCHAMQGDVSRARQLHRRARDIRRDPGDLLTYASDSISEGVVELLADDPAAAEKALRKSCDELLQGDGATSLANVAALLARALIRQGKFQEAPHYLRIAREKALGFQLDTQIRWREQLAIVRLQQGRDNEARELAFEAVSLSEQTEQVDTQAEALTSLAEVLHGSGDASAGLRALDRATTLYRRKGNRLMAYRLELLRQRLTRKRAAAPLIEPPRPVSDPPPPLG